VISVRRSTYTKLIHHPRSLLLTSSSNNDDAHDVNDDDVNGDYVNDDASDNDSDNDNVYIFFLFVISVIYKSIFFWLPQQKVL
jgi:hypothetical protein